MALADDEPAADERSAEVRRSEDEPWLDPSWFDAPWLDASWTRAVLPHMEPPPGIPRGVVAGRQRVLEELGRAALRLRLFRGWTQRDLEWSSGVDQTTISRFEHGRQRGLSIRALAAMLEALKAGRVEFLPPKGPEPTPLELMLYGDRWERAGRAAEGRLARRRR
jgi:transcriptional regulator with XRE-family HTH domain